MQLCPSTGKIVGIAGWKNIYEIAPGREKSNLTFLGTFEANGAVVTPMIIYSYIRLPKDTADSVPDHFHMATSETSWIKSETFYEYLANAFNPWSKNIKSQNP